MADKRGLEKLDFGALSIEQQQQLRQFKVNRLSNDKHLRAHPEVEALISDFLRFMYFSKDPDIREYAAGGFNQQHKLTRTPIYRQGQSST
uniref:RIIa domain-containing protein n=1 Tax=Oncorhynchus mykiss TaxID=8022 RepID=A0A8C7VI17_ONCMY